MEIEMKIISISSGNKGVAYSQKIDKKKSLKMKRKVKINQIIINSQTFHNTQQILKIIL